MDKALAVVRRDSDATTELLREAGEFAAGVDAELVVLHVMPEDEYEDRMGSRMETGSGGGTFSIDEAEREATFIAKEAARDAFADVDVDYELVGIVGHVVDDALDVADQRNCDHLFVSGRRRSPSGKAFFGDVTQRLLLNFDGMVTVSLHDK
ncbi:universal stress protein [Halorubellus sp. JP-L1]|uniref:universal stress protein n=1 Tax=Halorubellus sp. JP-L1 TaxID=2715753 RepID=UPI00140B0B04|nr:universal stress protein [Halorubellus sp. JP-L1]NHN41271.1 universal stress protein [Halorubellus sp. JP-L1]